MRSTRGCRSSRCLHGPTFSRGSETRSCSGKLGVLSLAAADDATAAQSVAVLARNGIRHEVLDHDTLAQRYPQIAVPPGGWGIFEPDSGGLFARRAVQALVEDNLHAGAELRIAAVDAPAGDTHLADIRTDTGEAIQADRFVFACGPWLGSVLPDVLGGRIFPTRQEVFYFETAGDRRFAPPDLPIWLDFGLGYYGLPDIDGRGFKVAHDAHGEAFDPDTLERLPTPARIAHARDFLARRFPALAAAPLLASEVCQYENTWNGDFVIDRHPSLRQRLDRRRRLRPRLQARPGGGRVPGRAHARGRAGRTTLQPCKQARRAEARGPLTSVLAKQPRHAFHERRIGHVAHLLGARDDAAVAIEQQQHAGVVELAIGELAVTHAEHAGHAAHVLRARAGQ